MSVVVRGRRQLAVNREVPGEILVKIVMRYVLVRVGVRARGYVEVRGIALATRGEGNGGNLRVGYRVVLVRRNLQTVLS
jgi:hypothetical protein